MLQLTCYKLRTSLAGVSAHGFDDFLDPESSGVERYGPHEGSGFEAMLYVASTPPHDPPWADFLRTGFGAIDFPRSASVRGLLVVRVKSKGGPEFFGFAFGVAGRHLLRNGAWERGYGLRAALNLLYPQEGDTDSANRILALDAKRRGQELVRSRRQSARASSFEIFDLDRFRDVVSAATGRPRDSQKWGKRVTGGDALRFKADVTLSELGGLARSVADAHARIDYREHFGWLDHIRPVTDPELVAKLEEGVMEKLRQSDTADFDLAPPEIIDWTRVDDFRFHFDRSPMTRPEIRLDDYLRGLAHRNELKSVDASFLGKHAIKAIDSSGDIIHKWPVWRCLFGEVVAEGRTFVLDEGDFFAVANDYLKELDEVIAAIEETTIALPPATPGVWEQEYNREAAQASQDRLLLDTMTVKSRASTTPVEICDILTKDGLLLHVKRELGSRDLSHLFAQGRVSAALLQDDSSFRQAADARVKEAGGGQAFALFADDNFAPAHLEVVYVILANWRGRSLSKALPFFSKVNLRPTVQELRSRGFRVSYVRVPYTRPKQARDRGTKAK